MALVVSEALWMDRLLFSNLEVGMVGLGSLAPVAAFGVDSRYQLLLVLLSAILRVLGNETHPFRRVEFSLLVLERNACV